MLFEAMLARSMASTNGSELPRFKLATGCDPLNRSFTFGVAVGAAGAGPLWAAAAQIRRTIGNAALGSEHSWPLRLIEAAKPPVLKGTMSFRRPVAGVQGSLFRRRERDLR